MSPARAPTSSCCSRDLDVLRAGVEDGRRTFANTLKYISITTSANFGNMVSMALATPLLPFLPLAAKQILLNNFLSDVPSIAISSDNVDPDRVERPQRWNIRDIQKFMIVFGLISSVFDLLTFAVLLLVLPCERGDVPDLVVPDLAPDRTGGGARPAHPQARLSQPPQPVASLVDPRRGGRHLCDPVSRRAEFGIRLRAAVGPGADRRGGDRQRIHPGDRSREGMGLPGRECSAVTVAFVVRNGRTQLMRIAETDIRRLFRASLWLKGAHSLVEVLSGLALALISHDTIVAIATALTRAELMEDPRDLVANALRQAAEGFTTDTQSFAAWYLFSHGLIKLVLVAAVLANRVWAYPAFMAAMIGFILYQAYRMSFEVSFVLVAITVLDAVVLVLAWHEYGYVRRKRLRQRDTSR